MGEREHVMKVDSDAGGVAVQRSVGKHTAAERRYATVPRVEASSLAGGEATAGAGAADAVADPFAVHLLGAAGAAGAAIRPAMSYPIAVQRAADPAAAPVAAPAAAQGAAGGALIVGDDQPATEGRMGRTAFLDLLHREVTATAGDALGPVGAATGCPYIEQWFARHAGTDAASLDRMARRYAGPGPRTAAAYVPPICARLRASIERWRSGGDVRAEVAAAELSAGDAPAAAPAGPPIQRKAAGDGSAAEPGSGAAVLDRLGAGSPLPAAVAARMEPAFGDRFGDVRIHTDQAAQTQAREQGALAFTVGHHVAFAAGQFRPGSPEGDALLAHELAHVQQQRGGDAQALARKAVEPGGQSAAEHDADRAAAGVLRRLYGGARDTAGRIGAQLSTGLGLARCRDPQPAPRHDAGAPDTGTPDGGAPSAPAVTEATVTALLQANPVDPAAVLGQLRQLAPVGASAAPGALDTLIDTRLTGDARWRAHNLRVYGPEDSWPPILRGDTAAILSAARGKITSGAAPEPAAAVADALRPLNPTAQHQAITVWRNDIPASRFGGGAQRTAYFDSLLQLLDGARYAPADDLGAVPPILDLESRSETELYAYFQRVCSARGFTFAETDTSQLIDRTNPLRYNAFNIRGYDQTTTAAAATARMTVTHGTDFTGRMFLVWRDAAGPHVRNWEWSNTGIGGHKLGDTRSRGDDLLQSEGGVDRFSRDSRGRVSRADARAITAERDAETVARAAEQLAADATTAAAAARTQADQADAAAGDRSRAGVATTGTQALAQTALAAALGAKQTAERAILNADRAIARLHGAAPPAGVAAPADSKTAAQTAKTAAEAAFTTARGAWLIARQQLLATQEETTRREWERLEADASATAEQRRTARAAYDAARLHNNAGYGEGNHGEMSENNALPWLQEGQYVAHLRSGDKGGHPFWAVDSGIGPAGNGTAPVDRDWDGDGRIDPGERDVPGTAVGTGVLIHRGDSTRSSIGCQVAPDNPFGEFVDALSGQGSPARSFAYLVVEGRHLPPWTPGGAAAATGTGTGGTPGAPASGASDGGTPADGGGH